MSSVRARLREAFALLSPSLRFTAKPATPEEAQALRAHCDKRLDDLGRIMALMVLVATIVWWPLDSIIYRNVPDTLRPSESWRLVIGGVCAAYVLMPRTELFRRTVFFSVCLLIAVSMGALGHTAGDLGGLEKPWFYFSYPLLSIPMGFPLVLSRRIVLETAQSVGWLSGLFLYRPEQLHSTYLPAMLSLLFLVSFLATVFGHYLFLLTQENFLQERALSRNAAELEGKVAEKTRELRTLLSYVERAREEERAHISRDLHDDLGQLLTAMRYSLALTFERFRRAPASIDKNLAELERLLQQTTQTVRGVVSDLRPPILDNLGLCSATEWLARRVSERTGIDCQATAHGDDSALSDELRSSVFRILQESLTNVARHAKAQRVEVSLNIDAEQLDLRIRDDGIGFSPAQPAQGMGLLGMRERALALGTRLEIQSQPGAGTEIRFSLPLRSQRAQTPREAPASSSVPRTA